MAKPRTLKRKIESVQYQDLISKIQFISVAQKDKGTPSQTHCIFKNNTLTAFNGVITAGCTVVEDLNDIYPHTHAFINALERCKGELAITQLEGKLSIKSGPFTALVPCYPDSLPVLAPDPPLCGLSESLRQGFAAIAHLADEDNAKPMLASIMLQSGSMFTTNGFACLEFYHGLNLPQIMLPKAFVTGICNTKKELKAFGYSGTSCTIHFVDDSWVKTQLYNGDWPELDRLFNVQSSPTPLPENFLEALTSIQKFSEGKDKEKKVYFADDMLQSHRNKAEGACYEVQGLVAGPIFGIELLKSVLVGIKSVDFNCKGMMVGLGDNVRTVLMGVRQ